jgi:hypothetical protein
MERDRPGEESESAVEKEELARGDGRGWVFVGAGEGRRGRKKKINKGKAEWEEGKTEWGSRGEGRCRLGSGESCRTRGGGKKKWGKKNGGKRKKENGGCEPAGGHASPPPPPISRGMYRPPISNVVCTGIVPH